MEISNEAVKKDIPYISVKACPVCREYPDRITESLERRGGHGYPGCHTYQYKCGCCKLLKGSETCDVPISSEEAINLAKQRWNEEVERVEKIMRESVLRRMSS
jgi:hypothetical protein